MATQEFVIRVVEVGANKAAQGIERIGVSARRSSGSVFSLANALRGIAAQQIASALVGAADAYTNLIARTRVFASSQEEAQTALRGVVDVALRTRQPLDAVSSIYQRLSVVTSSLGKSAQDTLRITETLTKATILSGSSSQEAEGALRQFTQGLAANRLSGQELNSVVEQSTVVAQLLARELGVGVGQLRALANSSRNAKTAIISTDVALRALANGADLVDERFAQLPVTFEQLGNVIKTVAQVSFGALFQGIGFSAGAIDKFSAKFTALIFDAEKVRTAITAFRAALVVVGSVALPLVTVALAKFAAAGALALVTFLGPFGLALVAASTLLVIFRDNVIDLVEPLTKLPGVLGTIARALIDALSFIDDFDPSNLGKFFESLTAGANSSSAGIDKLDKSTQSLLERFRKASEEQRILAGTSIGLQREIAKQNISVQQTVDEYKKLVDAGLITSSMLDEFSKNLQKVEFGEFTQGLKDSVADLDPLQQALDETSKKIETLILLSTGPGFSDQQFLTGVKKALADLAEVQRQAELISATGFSTISVGAQDALIQIRENIGSASLAISDGFVGAFGIAEDALNQFLTTGKFSFKDFARSIIGEIQKVLTQLLVLNAIKAFGNAFGGPSLPTTSGIEFGSISGRAAGGPVQQGRAFTVGENGRELFVPPTSGQIVPLGDGAAPQVNVQVVNVSDPKEVVNAMSSREGEQAILNIISRNRGRVRQSVS